MVNNETMIPFLEWELLDREITLITITEHGFLPGVISEGRLERDDDYNIKAVFTGTGKTGFPHPLQGGRLGEIIEGSTIVGLDESGYKVTLTGAISGGFSRKGPYLVEKVYKTKVPLYVDSVIREINGGENEGKGWLSVWCLNGERPLLHARSTQRKLDAKKIRSRCGSEPMEGTVSLPFPSSWDSSDYSLIKADKVVYVLSDVPNVFGPEWSDNIALEFPSGQEAFDNSELRKKVLSIVSYILGRRLIPVGYTIFDNSGVPYKQVAGQPLGTEIKRECDNASHPPTVPIRSLRYGKLEEALTRFTDMYLTAESEFGLSMALNHYWCSYATPLNISYAAIMMGIEMMVKSWYKTRRNIKVKTYIDPKEWDKITEEPFAQISQALINNPSGDIVLGKLKNAMYFSKQDEITGFLKHLKLRTKDVEGSIFETRNKIIHGGYIDARKGTILSLYVTAARTLFNRVFLKLIGYNGVYTDYSTYGYPTRKIDEPLGGPEGDGCIPKV